MYPKVHHSIIYNIQNNEVLLIHKKEETLPVATIWMDLEGIKLS